VETSQVITEAAAAESRRSIRDLLAMRRAVGRESLDVFFYPSVYSYFPVRKRQPLVVGIHDAIPDRNPQYAFASRRQEFFWRAKMRLAIAQADRIVTVSEYSRKALREILNIPSERMEIVSEGVSPEFRKLDLIREAEPFVLYVGGLNPHKNISALIRAFAKVREARAGLRLVLAGGYAEDRFKVVYQDLRELVRKLGIEDSVTFAGYVSDEELCRLYNRAALFASASLDEGFGLPVLEAMACGTPVVVNSGNAMEEIAGDAGLVVDARDEAELARAIERILGDPGLAAELSARGLRRAASFSWDESARRLLRVLEETVSRK
jgi:glycosyltransferase involved in cell wall biosynthesis